MPEAPVPGTESSRVQRTHVEHGDKGFMRDQREFFDKLITQDWHAYITDRAWDRNRAFEVELIMQRVGRARKILDVGCGCGYHDVLFAQQPAVERVLGVDYSKESVATANREYPHGNVSRRVADLFEDRVSIQADGPFDLVVSFQVIEHLEDPEQFLRACASFAVSGGHVVTVTPNRLRAQNRVRMLRGLAPEMVDPLHFREFAIDELKTLGARAGLIPVSHFGRNFSFHANRWLRHSGASARAMRIGARFPSIADVIGVVFRKP